MADTQTTPWDQINVDESVSEAEQAASNDISTSTPVGKFLCRVVECNAVEKSFKAYSCYAANLKLTIEKVIEIEQPIIDDKGQPIKRDGEIVQKIQPIPADKVDHFNNLHSGKFIFDDVNLFNPAEKEAMKNRRLFVAKNLQIITPDAVQLPTAAWANSVGCKTILTTEHNSWKDKTTGDIKKNVKVAWSGYELAETAYNDDVPFGDDNNAEPENSDNEGFDI